MPRLPATNRNKVKTERISVVITPKMKDQIDKIRYMQRKTLNELMNDIIQAYIKKHGADLKKFKETFEESETETKTEEKETTEES